MNATEQKNHKTALSALEDATTEALSALKHRCVTAVNDERTSRLKLADEQRNYVDAADRKNAGIVNALADDFVALRRRGFWSRLNWLLTGR